MSATSKSVTLKVATDISATPIFLLAGQLYHIFQPGLRVSALKNNAIEVGTSTCFAQGWFVSTGDLASSVSSAQLPYTPSSVS
jgi:hypothetical protein